MADVGELNVCQIIFFRGTEFRKHINQCAPENQHFAE